MNRFNKSLGLMNQCNDGVWVKHVDVELMEEAHNADMDSLYDAYLKLSFRCDKLFNLLFAVLMVALAELGWLVYERIG